MDSSIYTRPNKPRTMEVRKRSDIDAPSFAETKAPVEIHATSECHVTPLEVAARMVDYLEATQDMITLEPSAGTGNIVKALLDSGHTALELVAIERSQELCKVIRDRFKDSMACPQVDPLCDDFLEYAEKWDGATYPRIIMNPPFKKVRQHMAAAINMLGAGAYDDAVLVALVPVTYKHPDMIELEFLDNDTFASAKVNTKIIRIEK